MKRKSVLAVLALLLILTVVNGSVAYFTSRDKVDNVFTVGSVKIRLEEPNWDPTAEHIVVPGVAYAKDPTVVNTGENDAYVRLHCVVSDYAALTGAAPANYDPATMFGSLGDKWTLQGSPRVAGDSITYTFCYTEALPAGQRSQPLFETVTMPDFLNTTSIAALGGELTVTLRADAIQSQSFTDWREAFQAFDRQTGA